jgi:hypothetical protein
MYFVDRQIVLHSNSRTGYGGLQLNLDYSPTHESQMLTVPQKTHCFLARSPGLLLSKHFDDF